MKPTRSFLSDFAQLLLSEHVVEHIAYDNRSVVGLHYLFRDIEEGRILAYALIEDEKMVGCIFGELECDDSFNCHTAFYRHTNTVLGLSLFEKQIVNEFGLKSTTVRVPISNKAPQLMLRRFGMPKVGITKGYFKNGYNSFEDCYVYKKEYNQ